MTGIRLYACACACVCVVVFVVVFLLGCGMRGFKNVLLILLVLHFSMIDDTGIIIEWRSPQSFYNKPIVLPKLQINATYASHNQTICMILRNKEEFSKT